MGRIRYIKPGFFTNEALAVLPPLTRLLFAGLWTLADCKGRLEDRPRRIKAELFPYDDEFDVNAALATLADADFIRRYAAKGRECIAILAFQTHQKPHPKEKSAGLPEPPKSGAKKQSREQVSTSRGKVGLEVVPRSFDLDLDLDLNGDGDRNEIPSLRDRWLTFWSHYPRKTNKKAADKAFTKLKPDDRLMAAILSALAWQSKQPDWLKAGGRFVPHAATWLNGRRWEDEPFHTPESSDPNAEGWDRILAKVGE
jgi:hypothetical protein